MTDRELREFKEWFEKEWTKVTEELKEIEGQNLGKINLVPGKE